MIFRDSLCVAGTERLKGGRAAAYRRGAGPRDLLYYFFFFITLGLELSDTTSPRVLNTSPPRKCRVAANRRGAGPRDHRIMLPLWGRARWTGLSSWQFE